MVIVRKLSPETQEVFLEFMDGPAFESQPRWLGCYCQEYLNTKAENDVSTPETNRLSACHRIDSGVMNGYLAFESEDADSKVIGWLSANAHNNYRLLPSVPDEKTATLICFSIQKQHQGKGIANHLLEFALKDLKEQDFMTVQAAPIDSEEFQDWGYRGSLGMYLKHGFSKVTKLDDIHVLVSKPLT